MRESDFVRAVDAQVRATRADWEWRRHYMNMQERLDDAMAEGIEKGMGLGVEQGRAKGEEIGIEKGELQAAGAFAADRMLTIEDAAARLGVPAMPIREEMAKRPD